MKTEYMGRTIISGFVAPSYWAKNQLLHEAGYWAKCGSIYEGIYPTERKAINAMKRKIAGIQCVADAERLSRK